MYYLAVEIEDGELLVWEHLDSKSMIDLRNLYVHLGAENVRSGRMKKKVDNLAKDAMFV
tara:strand:- start:17880 stop:18056 length:177 start_codon:yes stop_codon:yes gene_type:complete